MKLTGQASDAPLTVTCEGILFSTLWHTPRSLIPGPCLTICVPQFVFAITEASDQLVGGHVWRSDQYGQAGSWKDVTQQMEGMPSYISCNKHPVVLCTWHGCK